jgi:hypothetical protein
MITLSCGKSNKKVLSFRCKAAETFRRRHRGHTIGAICDSCASLIINGQFCHEQGCPVAWRDMPKRCTDCGCNFYPTDQNQASCCVRSRRR